MSLLPFSTLSLIQPLLAPLCSLVRNQWLREADVDGLLRHAHPLASLNRHYARVEARYWVADDMLALRLRPNAHAGRGARPGQHLQLLAERDGVRVGRSYSLTRMADERLEIAVKRHPGGRVSSLLVRTPGGRPACRVATRARRSALADAGRGGLPAGRRQRPDALARPAPRGAGERLSRSRAVAALRPSSRPARLARRAGGLGAAVPEPGVALDAERRYGAGRRMLSGGAFPAAQRRLGSRPGTQPRAGLRAGGFRRGGGPGVRCQQPQPAGGKLQPAELG